MLNPAIDLVDDIRMGIPFVMHGQVPGIEVPGSKFHYGERIDCNRMCQRQLTIRHDVLNGRLNGSKRLVVVE